PSNERQLQLRQLPSTIRMAVTVEGTAVEMQAVKPEDPPHVMISSDGEMTPFQMELTVPDEPSVRLRLIGGMNGKLTLDRVAR
ncbi:MAG: hypothetical protein HQL94_11765, partial [Magnetococcales bacterium]|nr:hypothetical protein [Magnetococcales bacterium]